MYAASCKADIPTLKHWSAVSYPKSLCSMVLNPIIYSQIVHAQTQKHFARSCRPFDIGDGCFSTLAALTSQFVSLLFTCSIWSHCTQRFANVINTALEIQAHDVMLRESVSSSAFIVHFITTSTFRALSDPPYSQSTTLFSDQNIVCRTFEKPCKCLIENHKLFSAHYVACRSPLSSGHHHSFQ